MLLSIKSVSMAVAVSLCVIVASPAQSRTRAVVTAAVADTLHYRVIESLVGRPDEDEVTFLKRAAKIIHEYSYNEGFEFCGNVARQVSTDFYGKTQTLYAVNITTNDANVACVSKDIYPPGFNLIGKSIHSHGKPGTIQINNMDVKLSTVFKSRGQHMGKDLNHFSDVDLQHPGYLVTSTNLIYQNGTGKADITDYGKF